MLPAGSGRTAVGAKKRADRPGTLSNRELPFGCPSPAYGQTVPAPFVCQIRCPGASAITNVPSGSCATPVGPDMPPATVRTELAHIPLGGSDGAPLTDESAAGTGRSSPSFSRLAVIRSTRASRRGPSTPRAQKMLPAPKTSAPPGAVYTVPSEVPGLPSASTSGDCATTSTAAGVSSSNVRSYSYPTSCEIESPAVSPVPSSRRPASRGDCAGSSVTPIRPDVEDGPHPRLSTGERQRHCDQDPPAAHASKLGNGASGGKGTNGGGRASPSGADSGWLPRQVSTASQCEIEDGPFVRAGVRAQPAIGVHHGGPAHDGQHRVVGQRVAVRVREIEPQAMAHAILADPVRLVRAFHDGRDHLAGSESLYELQRVGDQIIGAEVVDERPHRDVDGTGAEDDLASCFAALGDDVQRSRVDRGLEHFVAEVLRQLDQPVLGQSAVGAVEQLVEDLAIHPLGDGVDRRQRQPPDQALRGAEDGAPVEDVIRVRVHDVGRDQRAVDVEEGPPVEAPWGALSHGGGP